jgi:DHA1 family bicyclomycin/chloramphenicol resistance-like MFS transporter
MRNPVAEPALVSCCFVLGVAPVVAPVLGGSMVVQFEWQTIFLFLTVFAGLCLFFVTFFRGQSLPSSRQHGLGLMSENRRDVGERPT